MIEFLEPRQLFAFANWSSIQPAIALVPASAGQLTSVSVVNFGTTVYTGPLNVSNTLNRIRADDGPDRSDDGIVYTSPQASGLPVDGTYYEFTVEPATGTDQNFSGTIASPGPMRILLATGGDCFFTGDHYSTFEVVYEPGSTPTPVIGSFTDSPTSVVVGSSTTLTAGNVSETGGTISGVNFYRESNGTAGLQTSGDTLIGSGTQNGSSWSISTSTTGLSAGTYTYYAVATDSGNVSSAVASTTLVVTATSTPTIGSFTDNPSAVVIGGSTTLTATGVTESGGTIAGVEFYRESNGTAGLQTTGDTLVGGGTQNGSSWSISTSTTGLAAATYTYYAVATDTNNITSPAASTTLLVSTAVSSGVITEWDAAGLTSFGPQNWSATASAASANNSPTLTGTTGDWTSKFDLGSGALDLAGVGAAGLATVTNQIQQGYNLDGGGNWTGTGGIVSSTAAGDSSHLTSIGAILNNDGNGNAIYGTGASTLGLFGGTAPGLNDVLVKYTYIGDANLDGKVDGSDYSRIDNGFNNHLSGWANGDFNYDGVVDGSDYTLIDNVFNSQGTTLPTNLITTGLTRGAGVQTAGTAANNAWGGSNWASTSAAGITAGQTVTFGLLVSAGYSMSLTSLDLNYRHSSSGPVSGYWQYQLNDGAWATLGDFANQFPSTSSSGAAITEMNLSGIAGLQNLSSGTLVHFRLTPYGATGTGGTFYVFDTNGNDLVVNGSASLG